MRFHADGPAIPDELLIARDEGRVIFFCGAGVSRAHAELPTFSQLAERVTSALEGPYESPTRRIVKLMQDLEEREGIPGLISADRVFGYLEREFETRDIHAAVAKELRPVAAVNLSAHRILLDLSTAADDKPRLVTTNFDLLFEACDSSLRISHPPGLPDPRRRSEMEGIIHLHGRVTDDYSGAEADGFVLSTAEFGRAYITDRWATSFIRAVLEEYLVVFVGYTADDPPVQYLLEGLRDDAKLKQRMYAFYASGGADAEMRWQHKGVQPIVYTHTPDHRHLWNSLEQWVARARNSSAWYENVIDTARKGPAVLAPHERGQVAHVVSTPRGARKFAEAEDPPPAEWLCVFDPATRYARPTHMYKSGEDKEFVDPFEFYSLDSDAIPPKADPDEHLPKRDIPKAAWDALTPTRTERAGLKLEQVPALRGYCATTVPPLPNRLSYLGAWIGAVAAEPAAVWWAAAQSGLHPDVQRQIHIRLERRETESTPEVREAWRYLFEAWQVPRIQLRFDFFDLRASIAKDGWSPAAVRQLALCYRPHFVADRPWSGARPPQTGQQLHLGDMVSLDVKYPRIQSPQIEVPDEHLIAVIREYRRNLEIAIVLEKELGGYALDHVASIEPEDDAQEGGVHHIDDLSRELRYFAGLMKRLLERDAAAAWEELASWWRDDHSLFARLRTWMSGRPQVTSQDAGGLLRGLTREVFWKRAHQRDLLLVLARRWGDLSSDTRTELEQRLLEGPAPRSGKESDREDKTYRTWQTLHRIEWLRTHGVTFGFDVDGEIAKLRETEPEWRPEHAAVAAESVEAKVVSVRPDSDYADLLGIPRSAVLTRAHELDSIRADRSVERRSFGGLASGRPMLALSVLTLAARRNEHPVWAWTAFLHSEARKTDPPRRVYLIVARLVRLPVAVVGELAYATTEWLDRAETKLLTERPDLFDAITSRIVEALAADPSKGAGVVVRTAANPPEWVTEAINSPVGKLTELLMGDPSLQGLREGQGLPESWRKRLEPLLKLHGDAHRHAMTILAQQLSALYAIDPAWTDTHLLAPLTEDAVDASAIWSGFLRRVVTSRALLERLKEPLLTLERAEWITRHGQQEALANLLLLAWGAPPENETDKGQIANVELRRVLVNGSDDFRAQLLWLLEKLLQKPGENATEAPAEPDVPTGEAAMEPAIVRHWRMQTRILLSDVWPLNKTVKTSQTSARLCELAFSSAELFAEVADIVARLVGRVDGEHLMLYEFIASPDSILKPYTEKVLALLYAVLSEDIRYWPHDINKIIDQIGTVEPRLVKDPRLIELQRRWDAR